MSFMISGNRVLKGRPEQPQTFKEQILYMLYEFKLMENEPKYAFFKKLDISAEYMIGEIEDETRFGKELLTLLEQQVYDELMFRRQDWAGVAHPDKPQKKEESEC